MRPQQQQQHPGNAATNNGPTTTTTSWVGAGVQVKRPLTTKPLYNQPPLNTRIFVTNHWYTHKNCFFFFLSVKNDGL